ncbi:MAG: porin family protein [Rhodocyclaceae bacterium]|nr:porin family protein [Rhodocyclaceae bacterium]
MKKIFAMTAIAAAIAMPASAQMYVGAGVGSASNENANGRVGVAPNQVDFSLDKKTTSWKLLGGMQLTPIWGVEVQYTDLGKRDITVISVATAVGVQGSVDSDQYSIAGTGRYMFSPTTYVHGKLGVTGNHMSGGRWCASPTACVSSGSETNTGFLWGFGLGHNFNKNWGIKGGYENFGKMMNDVNGKSVTASNMGVNVIYSF